MQPVSNKNSRIADAIEKFEKRVEVTKNVRFQAHLRLVTRHRRSTFMISLLSTCVIALSLLPNIIGLQQYQSQTLLACSVLLSVFVIFTSLLDGSQNFYYHGEMLLGCARKIAAIYSDLRLIDGDANPANARTALEQLQNRYQEALGQCPVNHEDIDYFREIADKPELFPERCSGSGWRCWITPRLYGVRAAFGRNAWMMPHAFALLLVGYVVYRYVLTGAVATSLGCR